MPKAPGKPAIILIAAATAVIAAFPSAPAAALDSVDDALCVCADDVLNTGDYVSCVAEMTRRLEAKGTIGRAERSDLVASASSTDISALQDFCVGRGGSGDLAGYGTSIQIGTAYYPGSSPSGPVSLAEGTIRVWNFSPRDIHFVDNVMGPDDGCLFGIQVLDEEDRVVRSQAAICLPALQDVTVAVGDVLEFPFGVPLVAENADPATGLVDGQALPSGAYQIVGAWRLSGPETVTGVTDYLPRNVPAAGVPIRLGGSNP